MRLAVKLLFFTLLLTSLNFTTLPIANAGCQDYPESVTPQCVAENLAIAKLAQEAYEAAQAAKRLQEEQTARDNAAKDAADRAATVAADNALSPDDCARSTNRFLQRCIDASVEKARIENETIDSVRKATEFDALQKIANDKFLANNCDEVANKLLEICVDSAVGKDSVKKATMSVTKKLRETQSTLTEPVLNADGTVVLNALLKSKSLSTKDISNVLATKTLNSEDKKLLSSYAQKLNEIKSTQSATSIRIPLSKSLFEEFTSATPLICRVNAGFVKTLKSGVCILNIKFATESGFEVETTKKITIKR
jgi:hypothetical protein